MKNIALLGGGEIGKAISFVLSNKGINTTIFDQDSSKCNTNKGFDEIFRSADIIFLCVPSEVLRIAIKPLKPLLREGQIFIPISKGIAEGKLSYEVVKEELGEVSIMLMSGAMIAEEILRSNKGFANICGSEKEVNVVLDIFEGSNIILKHTDDFVGLSYIGILKNIYSILIGIAEELNLGKNFLGAVILQSFREMKIILKLVGGREETLETFSGISDFVATAFSEESANRKAGESIANGEIVMSGEGLKSLPSILEEVGGNIDDLPLLVALKEIVLEKRNARQTLEEIVF